MSIPGLVLCSRFAQPPNFLSLCGPNSKNDLTYYSSYQKANKGTFNILSEFSTLFLYLLLIAGENNIKDPFDPRVVEAYWLGNSLLHKISLRHYANHLTDTLNLKISQLSDHALPHHSFHVLNIYKRTGHLPIPHTLETMEACLIREGKVEQIIGSNIVIKTKPLIQKNNKLLFAEPIKRTISAQDKKDVLLKKIAPGDWVSYHWGKLCQKLSPRQLTNLTYYTNLSLQITNI